MIEISPDGWDFDGDDDEGDGDEGDGDKGDGGGDDTARLDVALWQETAFGAASDAACSKRWPLTSCEVLASAEPKPYGVFATQRRHIAGISELFRLDVESDDKARELVCTMLPVRHGDLVVSATRIRDGPSLDRWRREGDEGWATTQKLTPPRRWLRHLLALGAALGFWGSPLYG